MAMTPREKWRRLINPQALGDYGLSVTGEELKTFPDGRIVYDEIVGLRETARAMNLRLTTLGINVAETKDSLLCEFMGGM